MPYPLLLDENADVSIAAILRVRGYDVLSAREMGLLHTGDDSILDVAVRLGRVVFTHDLSDFPRIAIERFQQQRPHAGILLAPRVMDRTEVRDLVRRLAIWLEETPEQDMSYYCGWLPQYPGQV